MRQIITQSGVVLAFLACATPAYSDSWWLLQAPHTRLNLLLDLGERRLWLDNCGQSLRLEDYTESEGRVYAVAKEKTKINGYTIEQEIALELDGKSGRALLGNSETAESQEIWLTVTPWNGAACGDGRVGRLQR